VKTFFYILLIFSTLFFTGKAFSDVNWTRGERPVVHKFSGDETLWFVAQLYYIKGENFKKLMLSNGIQDPNKVADGTYLYIPDPVHNPFKKNLSERYSMLHEVREQKLAAVEKTSSTRSIASVVVAEQNLQKEADLETKEVSTRIVIDTEHGDVRRLF